MSLPPPSTCKQAPEYRVAGEQTIRGDVFSFGVILLELLTGRKPLDTTRPKGQQSLLSWVGDVMSG